MNEAQDVDGNVVEMNDQGEVLDASHSQDSDTAVTERNSAPGTQETKTAKESVKAPDPKIDYEKSYKELERTYTRDRQQFLELQKQLKDQYEPYKEQLPQWAQADKILKQDPQAFTYMQARLQGLNHTQAQSMAEQAQSNPHLSTLLEKVGSMEKFISNVQHNEVVKQTDNHLNAQEQQANSVYKTFFGKEMGQAEKTEMYNWMVENDIYNGQTAVKSLYAEKYAEAYAQKMLQDQKVKGQKVVQRTSTQNSSTAKASSRNMDFRESFQAALKEVRGET